MSAQPHNIEFGLACEKKQIAYLSEYFNAPDLIKTSDTFCSFDFIDEKKKIIIELKSTSRHHYGKFQSQLIGANKLDRAKLWIKFGYRVYLVFGYSDDSLYSFEITKKSIQDHCAIVPNFTYDSPIGSATCRACFIDKGALKRIRGDKSADEIFHENLVKDLDAWQF